MNNIIQFPTDREEFKHATYTKDGDSLGVAKLDRKIEIVRLNNSEFALITDQGSTVHSRESLSEFLWIAAYFLDSEQRNLPGSKIIGCDYKDGLK